MPETPHLVTSVSEFLGLVEQYTNDWFRKEKTWGPWFRGQTNSEWALRPTIYRREARNRGLRAIEDEIRQEFIVRAPSLCAERPQNSWEWYFLMQHSGAPTRLLDWTESAMIALFFAVRGKSDADENDAAVWILEPWKLNQFVADKHEVIAPGAEAGMVVKHSESYQAWLPDRYSRPSELAERLPVALYPTHFSRRISSQRSCFSIHGSDKDGFEHLPEGCSQYLKKVIIPRAKAHEIETSLSVAGIDELTIYPDLDGLGRWLSTVLKEETIAD